MHIAGADWADIGFAFMLTQGKDYEHAPPILGFPYGAKALFCLGMGFIRQDCHGPQKKAFYRFDGNAVLLALYAVALYSGRRSVGGR